MADLKISELAALAGNNLATADLVAVVDSSASETKKLTVGDLVANGVTLIANDTIPGAKILFAAGGIATADIADAAITTAKVADDGITAAKLANESTVDLVTTLPGSGAFTGQLALDTDDNNLYCWNGSAWISLKAAGSVNAVTGSTVGLVDIVVTTTGSSVAIAATQNDTDAANKFLAGPTSAGGTVAYRVIDGSDIPVATTSAKGGVIVNGEGLRMDSNTIEVNNDVSASTTHHVVTYDAKGLITGGRVLAAADLPVATSSAKGAVIPGTGLAVDSSGNLNHSNTATPGTYTKVTVDAQGHVSTGATLAADDIPAISAAKLTSGTIGSALIASDAVTAAKLADQSVTKFGGAGATDNVVTFPAGDYKGQFFFDEKNEDLYVFTGESFLPITVISGNLVNAGTYNANTNLVGSVTTAGSAAGFSTGGALPAPATGNLNYYVVVSDSGTGSGNAPAVSLAPPDMLISLGAGSTFQLIDVSNAIAGQTAANISVVATGNIAATNVQAALQELDTEKLGAASPTFTGTVLLGQNAVLAFEGSADDQHELTITCTNPTADRTIVFPNVSGNVVTTGDTGTVTSAMIADATIVNADVSATAEIAVNKLANGSARQLLQTATNGTDVEFTSNVDVPGTLDVTGVATFDSTSTFVGNATFNGSLVFEGATPDAHELTLSVADPGADVTVTIPASTTTLAGLAVTQSFTKAQRGTPVALTDGATIAVDMSLGNNFSVTLGGNRTLGDPTNVTAGQSGVIVVTQDGTGSRTLAYGGTKYKFAGGSAVTLTTTAAAVDVLAYYCESATRITVTSLLNVS
nr:phage-related tail fiber protein [uncultured Mediterranean phage uvMED]